MVHCSAYGCKSYSAKKEPGVSFHRFPEDPEKCKPWVDNMNRYAWAPSKYDRLCSKHFEERWLYKTDNNLRIRLLNQAVPTIFTQVPKYLLPRKLRKTSTEVSKDDPKPEPEPTEFSEDEPIPEPEPTDVSEDEPIPEPKPITGPSRDPESETPEMKLLRKKLFQAVFRSREKTKKIRVLNQSLKRKKIKVASLKQALSCCKKQQLIGSEEEEASMSLENMNTINKKTLQRNLARKANTLFVTSLPYLSCCTVMGKYSKYSKKFRKEWLEMAIFKRPKMEQSERNLAAPVSTVVYDGFSDNDLSEPGHLQGQVFKKDPLDEKEEVIVLQIDSALEIDHICRGCLGISDVSNMRETFIGGVESSILYENISNIKVDSENVPTSICKNCTLELEKIDRFIKMLKHSYIVLAKAAGELERLSKGENVDFEDYNFKKINVLQRVLQEKYSEAIGENMDVLGADHKPSDFGFSDIDFDDFGHSDSGDYDSSSDEVPLSDRLKTDVNKRNESTNFSKTAGQKSGENKKPASKKRFAKRKDNLENLSDNTGLNTDKEILENQAKARLNPSDCCPLCSKKVRFLVKHLESMHSLDWNESKCCKCSYKNPDKSKLMQHCRECELKHVYPDYVEAEELKVEFTEDIESDPDFELNGPDLGISMKIFDVEHNKNHPNKKRKRCKKFSCNKCENANFQGYEDIELHLKTVHATESECILCEQEFTNSFSLLYHVMVKHGKLKCCRLCLVSFRDSEELNAHYKSEEHNTKCTVCGEQFTKRKALYEHRRRKHLNPHLVNQKYKCPKCPKEFANQNNIRRHFMVAHNDLRFLCDTCGQSYTTKRNLKFHIQKFHEGVQVQNKNIKKNFFCEACGRELKIFHKFAIAMHRAKHKGHNFVCKRCYDSFATEQELKRHVNESGHHLYECDRCQAEFVREENWKTHLKNHDAPGWNKNMFATWGKSAKLRNDKGEYVCSYCPKLFKDKQRLDNHLRVHTNERPYKCHICSKGFKTWIHRKTHLNIHLGIKKWVCKYCGKAFTNSCTLKGHEMIHTGERPHRCPDCKKGFITVSAMKKHRLIHFKTGNSAYWKKHKINIKKDEEKSDSEREENDDFIYKYGQMFTRSDDVSYDESVGAGPAKKELD